MKTAVAQYWYSSGADQPAYVSMSERICRKYCNLHNYNYEVCHTNFFTDRHPSWGRVPFVRNLLNTYDRILFIDSDAFFSSPGISIENAIQSIYTAENISSHDMLVASNIISEDIKCPSTNINCGVWIVEQTTEGIHILDEWLRCGVEHPYTHKIWPTSQMCFNDFVVCQIPGIHVVKEYYLLQSRYGYFIRHLCGMSNSMCNSIMEEALNSTWLL